jgi:hypothetical protein
MAWRAPEPCLFAVEHRVRAATSRADSPEDTVVGVRCQSRRQGELRVPLQFIAIAKAATLLKSATAVLGEWNKLEPEQKALVREPGVELMQGLNELRRAVGGRVFHKDSISWDEARELALDPSLDFVLARRLAEVVRDHERIGVEELAAEVGAAGSDDGIFVSALEIAVDDGYIRLGDDGYEVTDLGDGELVKGDHIAALERAIVDYIEETGLAGRDVLVEITGAASAEASEFRAALECSLASQRVHWLAAGLYGLAPERLVDFAPLAEPADHDEPRELKLVVADVARSARALPVAAGAPALSAPKGDPLELLGKLKQLVDAGALSEHEFAEQKARLLAAI